MDVKASAPRPGRAAAPSKEESARADATLVRAFDLLGKRWTGFRRRVAEPVPGCQRPCPAAERLRPDVVVRHALPCLEEPSVPFVDVGLFLAVRACPDALQAGAGRGEPAPDVAEKVVRGPAFR